MKLFRTTILTVFLLTFWSASAQVVTIEPSFATQNDLMKVTFDATQGNGELEGFTGDVYLHTGVITTKSTSASDWKYVPSEWTEYLPKLKATSLGSNKWEFSYSPNIREFFGVTDPNEEVLEVAMLFKGTLDGSGDPDKVGRAQGGGDIFVELTTGEANAKFVNPDKEFVILNRDETLNISGIGSINGSGLQLKLLKNDAEIATTTGDTLFYDYTPVPADENITFSLIATNGGSLADTASFDLTVKDGNGALVDRPQGLVDGITYTSDTSVQLSLFAPGKDFIYVIGDFNNWTPGSQYLMNKEVGANDSVWFWLELDGLTAGEDYAFQYLVDGEIRIADPYSELVLHPFDDAFIPETVFPAMPEYPKGKTEEFVGVLSPGQAEYVWQASEYMRPDKDELVIYELLMRDFFETPSYTNLIDSLDYLERLGVNAIQLIPVNEFDGNLSWGYNPAFHLALDKYYGSPEEFKRFVDEAHKRNIAVILDVVLNHSFGQNPLVRLWNEGNYGNPTSENPYFNTAATHPFNVGYDFNHESSATRYYAKRVMEFWIEQYKVDGYRFDLSKGFTQTNTPNDVGAWGNYDQSRVDIWKDYANHLRSVDPDVFIILEHFADNTEEQELVNNGMMVWGNMNSVYNEATMGYPSNLSGVLAESRNFSDRNLVGYMESHDEQWLMFKNISYGACENYPAGGDGCETDPGDYNVRDLETALDRMELAGAFFYLLPGPKMMWQFGELGYGYGDNGEQCLKPGDGSNGDCPASAPGRTDNKPIRWDYQNNKWRTQVYKNWANMIHLRKTVEAVTQPQTLTYSLDDFVKSIQLDGAGTDVVVVGNFGVSSATASFQFTQDGTWYDYLNSGTLTVSGGEASLELQAGEYRIFTTSQQALAVSNEEDLLSEQPSAITLYQNYPNPFNPTTNLQFDLPQASNVVLEVYDITGRKVAELINGARSAGSHTVTFDASDLSSGMYFARLQAAGSVQIQKMILLK